MTLYLTREEEAMLNGEMGEARQRALEIIVALAKIYEAERLLPITSVQVSGVSYKNLGEAGLEFLEDWASSGATVTVPTTLNPAGIDLDDWAEVGFDKGFSEKQLKVIEVFKSLGITPTCTCTPYLAGNVPKFGDHIAWGESSAVSFANSVIGARTNREGGPSALASAICGKTAAYGYHLDENRKAKYKVNVEVEVESFSDFGALGYWTGIKLKNAVPFFTGIKKADNDLLKQLGAAAAASGGIALYHIEGITAEARAAEMLSEDYDELTFTADDLKEIYAELNSGGNELDLVVFGCPHASIEEIKYIASKVKGSKLKVPIWITSSKPVKEVAKRAGYDKLIEKAGGKILSDMCAVVAPMKSFGFKHIAVNSGKYLWYLRNQGFEIKFGSTDECINAAIRGAWYDTKS